jgi:hypothetical protein
MIVRSAARIEGPDRKEAEKCGMLKKKNALKAH